jgi:hypothetical protein
MSETLVADVRAALVAAVAADVRRRRRYRIAASIGAASVLFGVVVSGTASGTGWLFGAPAPSGVAHDMQRFERQTPPPHVRVAKTPGVPFGRPTAVAHVSGYTLYLLRTAAHECYRVEPNGGESCGPLEAGSPSVELLGLEVHADPRMKGDPRYAGRYGGGTVFGRTSAPGAATVEMDPPGFSAISATVDPRTGYFIGVIPASLGTALLDDGTGAAYRTADWRVIVRNASGDVVARKLSRRAPNR